MAVPSEFEEKPAESLRRQQTRSRLMDAAYDVFSEVGIHAASVEAIAERAGFTRGAFYSNFDTKEELFLALAERGNTERMALLQAGVDQIQTVLSSMGVSGQLGPQDIGRIVATLLEQQTDNRRWILFQTELRLLAMRDENIGRRFLEQRAVLDEQFSTIVSAAFQAVGLQPQIEVTVIATMLTQSYESALQDVIMAGGMDMEAQAHKRFMHRVVSIITQLTA